jgi:hypothetical protein
MVLYFHYLYFIYLHQHCRFSLDVIEYTIMNTFFGWASTLLLHFKKSFSPWTKTVLPYGGKSSLLRPSGVYSIIGKLPLRKMYRLWIQPLYADNSFIYVTGVQKLQTFFLISRQLALRQQDLILNNI